MRYPWTHAQWTQLHQRRQQQRLPHALLLAGPPGLGKADFARDLAQSLLCEQPTAAGMACQHCRSCARFTATTHPDFLVVEPEEPGKAIKVDQVRDLISQFALASHQGGYRIAIVQPAEQMNLAAANSLLKTLEEPPADSLILLISARPSLLPATILSRCQRLEFAPPAHELALAWLNKQHDIPKDAPGGTCPAAGCCPQRTPGVISQFQRHRAGAKRAHPTRALAKAGFADADTLVIQLDQRLNPPEIRPTHGAAQPRFSRRIAESGTAGRLARVI
jgi:DNA polymerase III delta' subunit